MGTHEEKKRRMRDAGMVLLRRYLAAAESELHFLITSTPAGERHDALSQASVYLREASAGINKLTPEEN